MLDLQRSEIIKLQQRVSELEEQLKAIVGIEDEGEPKQIAMPESDQMFDDSVEHLDDSAAEITLDDGVSMSETV